MSLVLLGATGDLVGRLLPALARLLATGEVAVSLPACSRAAVEKPFGVDADDAAWHSARLDLLP